MAVRVTGENKPNGWRSQKKIGTVQNERESAKSHSSGLGRSTRNSGRGWDERGGADYTIGSNSVSRSLRIPVLAVDLKETRSKAYVLAAGTIISGRARAAVQGFDFALRVKFAGDQEPIDLMVISTELFDEMLAAYAQKPKRKKTVILRASQLQV